MSRHSGSIINLRMPTRDQDLLFTWNIDVDQTVHPPIDRQQVHEDLVGTAQVRLRISMLCCVPFALGFAAIKFIDQVPVAGRLLLSLIGVACAALPAMGLRL